MVPICDAIQVHSANAELNVCRKCCGTRSRWLTWSYDRGRPVSHGDWPLCGCRQPSWVMLPSIRQCPPEWMRLVEVFYERTGCLLSIRGVDDPA